MHIETPPARRHRVPLTPLVDVVFILLFFFMLASSRLDWRALSLDLATSGSSARGLDAAWWTLRVEPSGLSLNGVRVTPDDLRSRLNRAGHTGLVVMPGPGVSLQRLVAVLDGLRDSGVSLRLSRPPAAAP